jgi:hypothetical protein
MNYAENKTYVRYHEILAGIRAEGKALQTRMEESVIFILNALDKSQSDYNAAQEAADNAQGQLVTDAFNGKTNAKTVEAAEAATKKATNLEQTMKSLSRAGGLAIIQLEKKLKKTAIELRELESLRRGASETDDYYFRNFRKVNKKNTLAQFDEQIGAINKEIQKMNSSLSILKKAQLANGNILFIDAGTKAAAEGAIQKAADGFKEIERMKGELIIEIESRRTQLETLKQELSILEEVQGSLNPELIADQLYGSEISSIILSKEYQEIDKVCPLNELEDRESIDNKLKAYIRRRAHGVM